MHVPSRPNDDERRALLRALAQASPLHADMLDTEPVDVEPLPTPDALGSVAAFRVTIHQRRRPVELVVADLRNGSGEVMLLGDVDALDALARRIGLELDTQDRVAEYVRFWGVAAVRHTDRLVESPADFRWIPGVTTDRDLRDHADRAARLARRIAVGHPAARAFPAEVTMLDQRTLHLRHLRVSTAGHVEEVDRVELTGDVPIPYTMP